VKTPKAQAPVLRVNHSQSKAYLVKYYDSLLIHI